MVLLVGSLISLSSHSCLPVFACVLSSLTTPCVLEAGPPPAPGTCARGLMTAAVGDLCDQL